LLLSDRIPPAGQGGAEQVLWRLAVGFAAAGQDVHVACTTEHAAFTETRAGIPTYHLHARYPERFRAWLSLRNPQTTGALRRLLARVQPDVVNAHNIHYLLSYHALKLARDAGAAVVFSGHDAMPFAYGKLRHFLPADGEIPRLAQAYRLPRGYNLRSNRFRYNPLRNVLIRRMLQRQAQRCTVPSQALADAWTANGIPGAIVVHNGIALEGWAAPPAEQVAALRQRLGLTGKPVILIAGRLSADKGFPQAVAALARLHQAGTPAQLLALGTSKPAASLPAAYAPLYPHIVSAGWLHGDELRAAFHLADVLLVPSLYLDPFPTVNLEAMAAAKPVVASCFGGSPELVLDGETGYIVNPLDTPLLAQRLQRLLQDAALRRAMGRRGQARVAAHFTLQGQVERMLALYRQALEQR